MRRRCSLKRNSITIQILNLQVELPLAVFLSYRSENEISKDIEYLEKGKSELLLGLEFGQNSLQKRPTYGRIKPKSQPEIVENGLPGDRSFKLLPIVVTKNKGN